MSFQRHSPIIALVISGLALTLSAPASAEDFESIRSEVLDKVSKVKSKLVSSIYDKEMHSKNTLKRIDVNGDHVISSAEYMNYFGEIFDALDLDQGNTISTDEWTSDKASANLKMASKDYREILQNKEMMGHIKSNDSTDVDRDEFIDFHQGIFEDMAKKGKDKGSIEY